MTVCITCPIRNSSCTQASLLAFSLAGDSGNISKFAKSRTSPSQWVFVCPVVKWSFILKICCSGCWQKAKQMLLNLKVTSKRPSLISWLREHLNSRPYVFYPIWKICFVLIAAMEQALSIMCVAAQREPKQVRTDSRGREGIPPEYSPTGGWISPEYSRGGEGNTLLPLRPGVFITSLHTHSSSNQLIILVTSYLSSSNRKLQSSSSIVMDVVFVESTKHTDNRQQSLTVCLFPSQSFQERKLSMVETSSLGKKCKLLTTWTFALFQPHPYPLRLRIYVPGSLYEV